MIEKKIIFSYVGSTHHTHWNWNFLSMEFFMTDILEFFQIITAQKQSGANIVHSTKLSKNLLGKSFSRSVKVWK